jgi:hypothetical protein
VLGGGIAGLLAARVPADHTRAVLIIERDQVNTEGLPRTGVPQDRQRHGLLPGGLAQIERWLPGFTREAQDLGAVLADPDKLAVYLDDHQALPGIPDSQPRPGPAECVEPGGPWYSGSVISIPPKERQCHFECRDHAIFAVCWYASARIDSRGR